MAADVSSVVSRGSSEMLITRDLLGGLSSKDSSNDLDLGLNLPLDHLKSEIMYQQQRCSSPDSPLSSLNKKQQRENDDERNRKASNFKVLEESYLELKLLTSASQSQSSVCTLDKVKSALQRAEQESNSNSSNKKRSPLSPMSSSDRRGTLNDDDDGRIGSSSTGLFAAACPGCLMYVMTTKGNPKCPRCNSTVPSPFTSVKKPRLDLNNSSM